MLEILMIGLSVNALAKALALRSQEKAVRVQDALERNEPGQAENLLDGSHASQ